MITLTVSNTIKKHNPNMKLGLIFSQVKFQENNELLKKLIENESHRIAGMKLEAVKDLPQIAASRDAYRHLGKEPSRYRLSAEALHRRIISGKGLYFINNIVDVINLSSLKTAYSIGGYDFEKINGAVRFDLGEANENYEAIGRGKMNIENLPVFRDEKGAFGSPTSDSERTKITNDTKKILLIVINFGGQENFEFDLNIIAELIENFCSGKEIIKQIV
jgi:DNA/RNA-binding domain of Phe-tRNA-synthetase-like protein